jgi:hypothetical protein
MERAGRAGQGFEKRKQARKEKNDTVFVIVRALSPIQYPNVDFVPVQPERGIPQNPQKCKM